MTAVLRFTGKRQLGELSPSEMVTTVIISNLAAAPIENEEESLILGMLPILVIASLEIIMSYISLKSPAARRILSGKERTIIKDGRLDEAMMEKLRISIDDLEEELREKGIFDICEVEEAWVETGGSLSVLLKLPYRNVTNRQQREDIRNYVIVKDGKISKEALEDLNIDEKYLLSKLKKLDLTLQELFIFTMDEKGKIFYERKKK